MKLINVDIDFTGVFTSIDWFNKIGESFGFFDGYGKNFNAMIDCLSHLRGAEEGMISVHLKQDECVLVETHHITDLSKEFMRTFLSVVETVNARCVSKGEKPAILLAPLA